MTNRLVSVGDDLTVPPALKIADTNLPAAAKAMSQLAAGVDLDTITAGTFNQPDNANATLALNYPFANVAGKLRADSSGSATYQTYQSYTGGRFAIRSKYAGNPFGPWKEVAGLSDLPPTTLDGGNATSSYTGSFNFDGGSAA